MLDRWLVTLQNLSASGRQWDTDVSRGLLQDGSVGSVVALTDLVTDMHWQVALERKGAVYLLDGVWQGKIKRQCSRCNAGFDWQAEGKTVWEFQLGADPEQAEAEAECESSCEFVPAPGEINMLDILREDIWLAWKADVICSESCLGLCQGCGINLNTDSCQCKQGNSDHPFAALLGLNLKD